MPGTRARRRSVVPIVEGSVRAGGPRAVDAIGEGVGELAGPVEREGGVANPVDLTDGFLRQPRVGDLAALVARGEQAAAALTGVIDEAFVGRDQHPAGAVQRVVLAAPVSEGLVLDAAVGLEPFVGDADDVERVCDLDSLGQHGVGDGAVGARQVERDVADMVDPAVGAFGELAHAGAPSRPCTRSSSRPSPTSWVDQIRCPYGPGRTNAVSSMPSTDTLPMRSGSSTSASP